ncbi:MAG: polysaccharide deacetylase family protein [Planctomycetaceae bacterium]|nr:polysaccharide deacetylase family protein [Planctomycetaceae bacterium]
MKRLFKQWVLQVEKRTGAFRRNRRKNRFRLLVLCYHSVVRDDSPVNSRTNIAVTVSQFEEQLAILRRDWQPVSLAEIDAACEHRQALPEYPVFVTFDDGFRNNLTLAAPMLQNYQVPAAVFVTSALMGSDGLLWPQEVRERVIDGFTASGRHIPIPLSVPEKRNATATMSLPATLSTPFPTQNLPENIADRERLADHVVRQCKVLSLHERTNYLQQLRDGTTLNIAEPWKKELYEFMNWDEVREICKFGVAVGAHTVSHPILATLTIQEATSELSECKTTIERELSEECFSLAYPNGGRADFNEQIVAEAKKVGFQIGFNLFERRNRETLVPMSIDRICITRDVTQLEFEKILTME